MGVNNLKKSPNFKIANFVIFVNLFFFFFELFLKNYNFRKKTKNTCITSFKLLKHVTFSLSITYIVFVKFHPVTTRSSRPKLFLKISQNSQENNLRQSLFLKINLQAFAKVLKHLFT